MSLAAAGQDEFDFVIVGGGAAGCVLAARLSEDPKQQVCLIEAGGSGRNRYVDIPAAVLKAQRTPELNWGFTTAPQIHMNQRQIPLPRGRGLGGSGLINGNVYFRGHPRDFDDWASAGAVGWSYRDVLPYFIRSECNEDFGDSAYHGRNGPMNVRTVTHPNPLNDAFFEALAQLGVKARADLCGSDSEGMALRQITVRDGKRETSARAFLRPALHRSNLRVLTEHQVGKILLDGARAVGIEARAPGRTVVIRARREIILCAGALQSPQLLLLSGIGEGAHLRSLGIEVRHELAGVGRNLHDHLAAPVHLVTDDPTSYGLSWRALPRNAWAIALYLMGRRGPLANNIFESAAFVKSHPELDRPDLQMVFQPAKRPSASAPVPIGHGFGLSAVGLYPRSRGRVTLASPDPFAPPRADPNLLSDARDLEVLVHGIRLGRQVFRARCFARYRGRELSPDPSLESDEDLIAYLRAESYTVHHPVGTCRIGRDPDAVVDPQLRVVGLTGLRVADASVFPSILGGNTHAAVVMVAEKAADLIQNRAAPPALAAATRSL